LHLAGFHPIKPSDVRPSGITGNSLEARYPKMQALVSKPKHIKARLVASLELVVALVSHLKKGP